jgi:prevent-host-death family protein
MTLHSQLKQEVGVRELHDQLSRYVRHAAAGSEVVVTMRGEPVARLTPIEVADPLADLRRRGLVQEPTEDWRPRPLSDRPRPTEPIAPLVSEQRR